MCEPLPGHEAYERITPVMLKTNLQLMFTTFWLDESAFWLRHLHRHPAVNVNNVDLNSVLVSLKVHCSICSTSCQVEPELTNDSSCSVCTHVATMCSFSGSAQTSGELWNLRNILRHKHIRVFLLYPLQSPKLSCPPPLFFHSLPSSSTTLIFLLLSTLSLSSFDYIYVHLPSPLCDGFSAAMLNFPDRSIPATQSPSL